MKPLSPCFTLLGILLCLALPAEAQQPSAPPLQPFLLAAPGSQTKAPKALAGIWQGTFKHQNSGGAAAESTYRVEIGPDSQTLKVSLVLPKTAFVTDVASNVGLSDPTTSEALPAVWDGAAVRSHSHEAQGVGATVDKKLGLCLERDNRHALFSYEIRLTSVSKSGTTTTTIKGSGTLTRQR